MQYDDRLGWVDRGTPGVHGGAVVRDVTDEVFALDRIRDNPAYDLDLAARRYADKWVFGERGIEEARQWRRDRVARRGVERGEGHLPMPDRVSTDYRALCDHYRRYMISTPHRTDGLIEAYRRHMEDAIVHGGRNLSHNLRPGQTIIIDDPVNPERATVTAMRQEGDRLVIEARRTLPPRVRNFEVNIEVGGRTLTQFVGASEPSGDQILAELRALQQHIDQRAQAREILPTYIKMDDNTARALVGRIERTIPAPPSPMDDVTRPNRRENPAPRGPQTRRRK